MTKQNNRNLSLLLILTQLGSGVLAFILSFSILQQNKSALDFSMTVVVSTIFSIITSVISGKFIDKYNKKRMLLSVQISSVLALFIFGIYVSNIENLSILYVVILRTVLQVCDTIFVSTLVASAIRLVDSKEDLNQLNSTISSINSICAFISPLIGGILLGVLELKYFVYIEVIFEAIAIIYILKIQFKKSILKVDDEEEDKDFTIKSALSYMIKNKEFLVICLSMFIINLFLGSLNIGLPFIIIKNFAENPFMISLIKVSIPLGMIIGSIGFQLYKYKGYFLKPVFLGWIIMSIGITLLGFIINILPKNYLLVTFSIILIILLLIGSSVTIARIPLISHIQSIVPENKQGRLFSILDSFIESTLPVGLMIYGVLFDKFNSNLIYIISGVSLCLILLSIYNKLIIFANKRK